MKLLLVEDDQDLGEFVREGLVREGFSVDVARTGQEAVDHAAQAACDVILLDIMMPGSLDWYAVLKKLRSRGYQGLHSAHRGRVNLELFTVGERLLGFGGL